MQEKLNSVYLKYALELLRNNYLKEKIINDEIASPLFINCDTDYAQYKNAKLKILFIGKENNDWFPKEDRVKYEIFDNLDDNAKYLNALTDMYRDFNLGLEKGNPIFRFLRNIKESINEFEPSVGILWTNLLRIDCKGNDNLKERIFSLDDNEILRKEFEILKPDMAIFVTGPNYDHFFDLTFIGNKGIQIGDKAIREMCYIDDQILPHNTIRIYHPDAYKYRGSQYQWELIEIIKEMY